MAIKLKEQTQGTYIFMRMKLDNGRIEEISVYLTDDGTIYKTSADHGAELDKTEEEKQARQKLRQNIIDTFNKLY